MDGRCESRAVAGMASDSEGLDQSARANACPAFLWSGSFFRRHSGGSPVPSRSVSYRLMTSTSMCGQWSGSGEMLLDRWSFFLEIPDSERGYRYEASSVLRSHSGSSSSQRLGSNRQRIQAGHAWKVA